VNNALKLQVTYKQAARHRRLHQQLLN